MSNGSTWEVRIYTRASKGYRPAFYHVDEWAAVRGYGYIFHILEVPDWGGQKKGESAFFIVRKASPAELVAFSYGHLNLFSLSRDMKRPPFSDEIKIYPIRLWKEPEHEDGSFSTKERASQALDVLCEHPEQAPDALPDGIFPYLEADVDSRSVFRKGIG